MIRRLPDFFVMGAQKSATTSLHQYLYEHPNVFLPEQKETKFFVKPEKYCNGIQFYLSEYFSGVNDQQVLGEVDPDYMYFEDGIKNINHDMDVSGAKFIFLLREPVSRAYSHYLMTLRRGFEDLSFEDALEVESERIKKDWVSKMHYSYFDRGKYIDQIELISNYVPKENMMFFLTEELRNNPGDVMKNIFNFIGVDPVYDEEAVVTEYHKGKVPKSLRFLKWVQSETILKKIARKIVRSKSVRERLLVKLIDVNERAPTDSARLDKSLEKELRMRYRDYNLRLAEYIDKDLSQWM